jgi:diguanylate cyclase
MDRDLAKEIELEYQKINEKWLHLHFLISSGLVLLALILEIGIGRLLYLSDYIRIPITEYLLMALVLPTAFNIILISLAGVVLHCKRVSLIAKTYTVSLVLVGICFIIFTVHTVFTALFYIFALPILLTAIYGRYKLSALISVSSILALILSELFTRWDPYSSRIMNDVIRLGNFLISIVTLLFFSVVSLIIIYFEKQKSQAGLRKEMERFHLRKKLEVDELTGINNRMAFRNAITEMKMDGWDKNYSFVMIDLDNFKQINDNLGHVAGDKCLADFGEILRKHCGEGLPFRYGGDEFSLLFENSSLDEILEICNRIRRDFNSMANAFPVPAPVSVSMGLARYLKGMTPHDLIRNSDTALYQSKMSKNCITVYSESFTDDYNETTSSVILNDLISDQNTLDE